MLWRLDTDYLICYNDPKIHRNRIGTNVHYSRLGKYILELGERENDRYSIMALAELYTKGIREPQDEIYARLLLLRIFSEKATNNLIMRWKKELLQVE